MPRSCLLLATTCLLLLARTPTPASACGGPSCFPDQFLSAIGSLPQNAQAIAVFFGQTLDFDNDAGAIGNFWMSTNGSDISFECTDALGARTAIPFEIEGTQLRPQRPLTVGDTCSVVGRSCGGGGGGGSGQKPLAGVEYLQGSAEFRVTDAAELPKTLGTLELQPAQREQIEFAGGASCGRMFDACAVRASIVLSKEATPWKDALIYSTWVYSSLDSGSDGEGWSVGEQEIGVPEQQGGSYLGRGRELFYYLLDDTTSPWAGLARGKHRVSIRATLPGTDVLLETPPQELSLDCGSQDAGVIAKSTSGSSSSSNVSSSSGCAVGNVRSSSPSATSWIAFLALVAAVRHARRSRARTSI